MTVRAEAERFNLYQIEAERTLPPNAGRPFDPETLLLAALGLAGETGEFVDTIKKMIFHDRFRDVELRKKLSNELGDILWYLAIAATSIDKTLEQIADENVTKLRKRYPDGFSPALSIMKMDEGGRVRNENAEWNRT